MLMFIPFSDIKVKAEALNKIASFFEKYEANIKKIQLTYKETLPKSQLHAIIKEIDHLEYKKDRKDSNKVTFTRRDVHKSGEITETYSIVESPDGQSFTWIASFESTTWDENIATSVVAWKTKMDALHSGSNVQKFACLQAETSDTIDDSVFLENVRGYFDLEDDEIQTEKVNSETSRKVIYGYTDLWADELVIDGNPMNMQVAMTHNKHNGTKITIGTPILINEY